mmetsp:Transcript_16553/g.28947  ORF Transcript_16553/g.28947 Transcript_16553/m.28947 type:complete len:104 (+) Transcript_16553:49-360(+)
MDFLASSVRGGVASFRGAKRAVRRYILETIYGVKEKFFAYYDSITASVNVEQRRIRHYKTQTCAASFSWGKELESDRQYLQPAPYDFTELQHGPNSMAEEDED